MGGRGHKTVALIAQHYLKPDVKRKITAMLAADMQARLRGPTSTATATNAETTTNRPSSGTSSL
jgi:hypothetical protein